MSQECSLWGHMHTHILVRDRSSNCGQQAGKLENKTWRFVSPPEHFQHHPVITWSTRWLCLNSEYACLEECNLRLLMISGIACRRRILVLYIAQCYAFGCCCLFLKNNKNYMRRDKKGRKAVNSIQCVCKWEAQTRLNNGRPWKGVRDLS